MEMLFSGWFILLAVLGFTFVIFIHELGHFLFAKWAGVKVERFSIGFGPIIWHKTIGETEYAVSLLPLGGYVKMLGEEDDPTAKDNPRSFGNASAGWRGAILFGGVLFNLISSYVLLLCLAFYGMPMTPPIVGEVEPLVSTRDETTKQTHEQISPAKLLGLRPGDRILTINGEPIRAFDEIVMAVATAGGQPITLTVQRRGETIPVTLPADGQAVRPLHDAGRGISVLGLKPPLGHRIAAVFTMTAQPPANAPRPGEQIVAVNGTPVGEVQDRTGQEIQDELLRSLGKDVTLTVAGRDGPHTLSFRYAGNNDPSDLAFGFPVRIQGVVEGSPAHKAGMRAGDVVESVNDQPISGTSQFLALVLTGADHDQALNIVVRRDGKPVTLTMNAALDNDNRRRIGAKFGGVHSGVLPLLPLAFAGQPNPLAQAGIKQGDAVVGRRLDGIKLVVQVVSGGEQRLVTLPEADLHAALEPRGLRKQSLLEQLIGSQIKVVTAAAGTLDVVDSDGKSATVDLHQLSTPLREQLLKEIQPGDRFCGLTVRADGDQADGQQALELVRGGALRTVTVAPQDPGVAFALDYEEPPYHLQHWSEAFTLANRACYNMVVGSLKLIPKFFTKPSDGGIEASKSLSGPIGIFTLFKTSAERQGFASYLKLVALIGLNLFLVNLLPIPIVDGGQLVFLGIEVVMRRPVPPLVKTIASYIGLALIVTLMLFVLGLDVLRLIGR